MDPLIIMLESYICLDTNCHIHLRNVGPCLPYVGTDPCKNPCTILGYNSYDIETICHYHTGIEPMQFFFSA